MEKQELEIQKERLEAINQQLKGHNGIGKILFRKLKVEKKRLIRSIKIAHNEIVSKSAIVDLTSVSVVPLSLKKSRYLRNTEGYHNNKNLLCAMYDFKLYVLKVEKSQITETDLGRLKAYLSKVYERDITLVCDNRHRGEIRGFKRQTQQIERVFSRIKKAIYPKLKDRQTYTKGLIFTDISYEELEGLYVEELRKLRATLINF